MFVEFYTNTGNYVSINPTSVSFVEQNGYETHIWIKDHTEPQIISMDYHSVMNNLRLTMENS